MIRRPPRSTLFPTRRSSDLSSTRGSAARRTGEAIRSSSRHSSAAPPCRDRKSTRLNSSHGYISYAVFCLKKKKKKNMSTKPIHEGKLTQHKMRRDDETNQLA